MVGLGLSGDPIFSTRSVRAVGVMALLCAPVDFRYIRLLGCWRSDEMLRYLKVQAQPIVRVFAFSMLSGGQYTLLPSASVPDVNCSAPFPSVLSIHFAPYTYTTQIPLSDFHPAFLAHP